MKEAAIVASVLTKVSVPVDHSSAALMRLASMEYTGKCRSFLLLAFLTANVPPGPTSLFIRVLIDKKYALPYKVLDGLVFHFIRLSNTYKAKGRGSVEELPVLWHQSLLVFCQRYVCFYLFAT